MMLTITNYKKMERGAEYETWGESQERLRPNICHFYKLHAELIINTTNYNNNGTMSGERTMGRLATWPALSQITQHCQNIF